jgi:glyoxylase-like metal-dependent hydrolase (beta-lactamase superfamily II)/rhodanese-related sulfurtransferase
MILKQFYLNCLAHASYLVGDESSKRAAVIDPQRDIDQYMAVADEHGLLITHVFLTHLHADFLAGHLELRDRTGAAICLGAAAKAEYPFTPLGDGDSVSLGRVTLTALETPGHTPESISIAVYDLDVSPSEPQAILTGDTLFIGDVGRPDLRVALGWSASDLGGLLYDSLHQKLLKLPDATLVYPAHGAGSLCGKAISRETVSTIGDQRRENYALKPMSKTDFVSLVTADQPDAPAYFTYDAVLNSRDRETLDQSLARGLTALPLARVLELRSEGAQLLDTRDPAEFAAAHLEGSIHVGLVGQYATWAGTLLDHQVPIVLIADPGQEGQSALRLGRIGFDNVAGYLDGGLASLAARHELTATTERLSPERAAEHIASKDAVVVDVRTPGERAAGSIDGSLAIPLSQLRDRLGEIPRERSVLVYCAGGYRSSIAASVLAACDFPDVAEIAGGVTAWEQAGQPVVKQ